MAKIFLVEIFLAEIFLAKIFSTKIFLKMNFTKILPTIKIISIPKFEKCLKIFEIEKKVLYSPKSSYPNYFFFEGFPSFIGA